MLQVWRPMTGLKRGDVTDNLATALDKAVVSKLGQLPDMREVDAALRTTLSL